MRLVPSLLLLFAVVACSDDAANAPPAAPPPAAPAKRDPPPRAARPADTPPAPTRSPLLREGDLGDWTPAHEDCAAATRFAQAIAADRCVEFTELTTDADLVRVYRAALRLADDRAARLLAERCKREWLDLWEHQRVSELLVAAAFDLSLVGRDGEPFGLDELYEFGGSKDLGEVLRRLRDLHGERGEELANFSTLHKLLDAGHTPALVELTRHEDEAVRRFAYEMLSQVMEHSNRWRAEIQAVIPADATEIRIPADAEKPAISAETLTAWRGRTDAAPDPPPAGEEARKEIERDLTGTDLESRYGMLDYLRRTCCAPGPWAAAKPEPWSAGLDRALLASDASWDWLVLAALAVPGCRTREVAEAAVARMPETCPIPWEDRSDADVRDRFAFLETAAPGALAAKLRRWATAAPPSDVAALFLCELRDESSVPAILAACERLRAQNWAKVPWSDLGGLHHADVRAFLVRHFEGAEGSYPPSVTMALEAIAEQDGFPAGVASWPWPGMRVAKDPIARLVLDGKPVEAFVATLANSPDLIVSGEGRVRDPRVRSHIESIRDRRELGQWFAATVELARAGDGDAISDLQRGVTQGRYRWMDDAAASIDALGVDAARDLLRFWSRHLETNCCLSASAATAVEDWFGWSPTDWPDPRWTPATAFEAWWDRHDGDSGRFEFSRIAGHWVPATR